MKTKKHLPGPYFFVLRMVAAHSYTRENIRNMSAQLVKLANGRGVLAKTSGLSGKHVFAQLEITKIRVSGSKEYSKLIKKARRRRKILRFWDFLERTPPLYRAIWQQGGDFSRKSVDDYRPNCPADGSEIKDLVSSQK